MQGIARFRARWATQRAAASTVSQLDASHLQCLDALLDALFLAPRAAPVRTLFTEFFTQVRDACVCVCDSHILSTASGAGVPRTSRAAAGLRGAAAAASAAPPCAAQARRTQHRRGRDEPRACTLLIRQQCTIVYLLRSTCKRRCVCGCDVTSGIRSILHLPAIRPLAVYTARDRVGARSVAGSALLTTFPTVRASIPATPDVVQKG